MSFNVGSSKSKVSSQAKYGPTADLDKQQQQELLDHYGTHKSDSGKTQKDPLTRLTQYDAKHSAYVDSAEQTGRPLTEQEAKAKASGANAPKSSIDHVIASGTGQNVLNEGTLQFKGGAALVYDNYSSAKKPQEPTDPGTQVHAQQTQSLERAKRKVSKGIADQAAAVGRMQGYNRAILEERQGEVKGGQPVDVQRARSESLKDTLTAYQGKDQTERFDSYKKVLKDTFDSPGNLRIGDSSANTKISTGFDAPIGVDGKPTSRAERLLQVHQTFAPDRLLTENRLFTKDDQGKILSSSKEVSAPPPAQQGPVKSSVKLPDPVPPELQGVSAATDQPKTSASTTATADAALKQSQAEAQAASKKPKAKQRPPGDASDSPNLGPKRPPDDGAPPPSAGAVSTSSSRTKRARDETEKSAPPGKKPRIDTSSTESAKGPSQKRTSEQAGLTEPAAKKRKVDTPAAPPKAAATSSGPKRALPQAATPPAKRQRSV